MALIASLPAASAASGAHDTQSDCDWTWMIIGMAVCISFLVLHLFCGKTQYGLYNSSMCTSLARLRGMSVRAACFFTCVWGAFVCCFRVCCRLAFRAVSYGGFSCCAALSSLPFDCRSVCLSKVNQRKRPGQSSMIIRPMKTA